MKRVKTFFKYAIIIIAFWFFSDILIYLSINSTYKNKQTRVYVNTPEIIVSQNKATFVNGVVKGKIINNTNEVISNKYLKLDMYSSRDVKLGTKYVKIEPLDPTHYSDFEMWYKFTGVEYVTISVVENISNATEQELISEETTTALVVAALIWMYFM